MNQRGKHKKLSIPDRMALAAGAVALFVFVSALLKEGPLEEGEKAPLFEIPLVNQGGGTVSIERLQGKPVVLEFFSTTCPPCLEQLNALKELNRKYEKSTMEFLAVSVGGESLKRLLDFTEERAIAFSVGCDLKGNAAKAYRVATLPALFIIDEKGKIVKSHAGALEESELEKAVDRVAVK